MFYNIKDNNNEDDLIKIAALLIHAAKIDENYSNQEDKIIKETMLEMGAKKENLEKIIKSAKEIENNTNQILDFTRKVKNMNTKKNS